MKTTNSLKESQKIVIAVLGTITILASVFLATNWYNNRNKTIILESDVPVTDLNAEILTNLDTQKNLIETRELLYNEISFLDLPIYPEAWVKRNFNVTDQTNKLISDALADPDKDGLTNKEEYFYGSDPNKAKSLCVNVEKCDQPDDKQAVDQDISPLTGLTLVTPKQFSIRKQDFAVVNRIQDSFETASKEGIDFPTLYQLSRNINLIDEINAIEILTTENNRESVNNYINARLDILEKYSEESELSNFVEIYEASSIEDLQKIKDKYVALEEKLQNEFVPIKYTQSHKAFILLFRKFQNLIDIRMEGFREGDIEMTEFQKKGKTKATELVWVYRYVSETESTLRAEENKNTQ
jgi:hypothetical protein